MDYVADTIKNVTSENLIALWSVAGTSYTSKRGETIHFLHVTSGPTPPENFLLRRELNLLTSSLKASRTH